jgi:hypothetical protein
MIFPSQAIFKTADREIFLAKDMPRGERRFCRETTRQKKTKLQSARKKETNSAIRKKIFFNRRFQARRLRHQACLNLSDVD